MIWQLALTSLFFNSEEDQTALIKNGMAFLNSLHGRHVPLEENEKEFLAKAEESKIMQKCNVYLI